MAEYQRDIKREIFKHASMLKSNSNKVYEKVNRSKFRTLNINYFTVLCCQDEQQEDLGSSSDGECTVM